MDFTPSEVIAINCALETNVKEEAKERMVAVHASPAKFPEQGKSSAARLRAWYVSCSRGRKSHREALARRSRGLSQHQFRKQIVIGLFKLAVGRRLACGVGGRRRIEQRAACDDRIRRSVQSRTLAKSVVPALAAAHDAPVAAHLNGRSEAGDGVLALLSRKAAPNARP
jgi:hypothetical protein